ncbi:MAG: hypothetical protein M1834_006172 [Cirrosporium novae-zelandiae]|nr:MAG: hypothetical protein M1834_006172 [Cirrosporium novae-zelandiae]
MNVNKKLDRFKQWGKERMGGEAKTNVSDEFKALEMEMALRHEGMERLQKSMSSYVKAMSKRNEGEDREKTLPAAHMGSTMVAHGEEFDNDSEFGQCLIGMGHTNERIARVQENYVANATSSWLESLERSLAQMKEYQAARKKLENRRLAYDAALAKMQKAKKEDFRVEEEFRAQKAKYEESSEECYRRMQDIRECESDSVADLTTFLEAELAYYDKCRDLLMNLKREWPAVQSRDDDRSFRTHRPRSNTAHSYRERFNAVEEEEPPVPEPAQRPSIRSRTSSSQNVNESPRKGLPGMEFRRTSTFEGPTQLQQDSSPLPSQRLARVTSDSHTLPTRGQLRPVNRISSYDTSEDGTYGNSPDRGYRERSVSPATSHASSLSRKASSTTLSGQPGSAKKMPPPPPPSRAKKPPPPPPPMKRSALSTSDVRYA